MPDLSTLQCRDDLGEWLNNNGLTGVGVEVGCLVGDNARNIISKWKGQQLCMIDPWGKQESEVYQEPTNDSDWNACMASCQLLADEYKPRVKMMRDYSPGAAKYFEDGSLDFCYIDANHAFEAIRADIRAWWPKVKKGGLFGGHDFWSDITPPNHCRVKDAVLAWSAETGLPIHYTSKCASWWFIKP